MQRYILNSKFAVLVFCLLTCQIGCCQLFVGLKSGTHIAKQKVYLDHSFNHKANRVYGFEGGIVLQYKFSNDLYLRSDLSFLQKGSDPEFRPFKIRINVLEANLQIGYEYKIKRFSVFTNIGGFTGYSMNGKLLLTNSSYQNINLEFDRTRNREDYGLS